MAEKPGNKHETPAFMAAEVLRMTMGWPRGECEAYVAVLQPEELTKLADVYPDLGKPNQANRVHEVLNARIDRKLKEEREAKEAEVARPVSELVGTGEP